MKLHLWMFSAFCCCCTTLVHEVLPVTHYASGNMQC